MDKLEYFCKDDLVKFLFDDVHRMELKINRPFISHEHFIKSKEICWQTSFEAFKKNYRHVREDFIHEVNKFLNENKGCTLKSIDYKLNDIGIYGNMFHLIARIALKV